jgi:hypothetical protein
MHSSSFNAEGEMTIGTWTALVLAGKKALPAGFNIDSRFPEMASGKPRIFFGSRPRTGPLGSMVNTPGFYLTLSLQVAMMPTRQTGIIQYPATAHPCTS